MWDDDNHPSELSSRGCRFKIVPHAGRLVAIVDDDESVRNAMKGLMRSVGFAAEVFSSAEEFLHSAELNRTGFLIADVNMPGMSGLRLHENLLLQGKAIPTVLITAYPSDNDRARALQAGVISYLAKPFDEHDLLGSIRSALDNDGAQGSAP